MKTLLKNLLLRPQRTLDLEYQCGGDDFKISFWIRDALSYRSIIKTLISHYREWTVGPLSSATSLPIFMQLTGQNSGGIASLAFLLARKCNWLARTCIMNMRNATCVETNLKGLTRVTPLFIFYSVIYCVDLHYPRTVTSDRLGNLKISPVVTHY